MLQKRWLAAAAALIAVALLAAAYLITPGCPLPLLPEGDIQIFWDGGNEVSLTWPDAGEGAEYLVEVHNGAKRFEERCAEPAATFTEIEGGKRLRVSVQAVSDGTNLLGMSRLVKSWTHLKATVRLEEQEALSAEGEAEADGIRLSWDGTQGRRYEVCTLRGGVYQPVASTEGKSLVLRFGSGNKELEFPTYDNPLQIVVREGISGKGYTFYGPPSNLVTFERGDLLDDALSLTWEQTGSRTYTLHWSETRADTYELQQWRGGDWETIFDMEPSDESFHYDTGRVGSGSLQRYRVSAKDSAGNEISSEEVSFYADLSTLYATIWPIVDLAYYESPKASRSAGRIPAGTTLCVLEETGNWFQVRYKDNYVYIDNRFCMINLPEYLGDYCSYKITNSDSSVFKIHDSPIAKITGQVIKGFEHVKVEDGYLAPFLYPCAVKLYNAAANALADGYRLKIYESFRPHEATRFLYDITEAQINLPALTLDAQGNAIDPSNGNRVNLATGLMTDRTTGNQVERVAPRTEPEAETPDEEEAPETPEVPETPESPEAPETPEVPAGPSTVTVPVIPEPPVIPENPDAPANPDNPDTTEPEPENPDAQAPAPEDAAATADTMSLVHYNKLREPSQSSGQTALPTYDTNFKIMTDNGRFRLGSFLAAVTSAHNRGIALDLTLEELDTAAELTMQSRMHDLSWYSATYRNNDNAKLLAKYMTAADMNGLSSEWWHFQDDNTRKSINLNAYLEKGVSAAGLVRDDNGWRYRNSSGAFAANTVVTVDGIRYTIGGDGYLIE